MTGEALPGDFDEEARRQLIETITEAVADEDYEFMLEVANSQTALRPFELAEYMNVKRKNSEDPVEQRRWHDGLYGYLKNLSEQQFPPEEVEILNGITRDLNFEHITDNEELAEEPEYSARHLSEEEVSDWESYNFDISLDTEEIDGIRAMPFFKKIEAAAMDTYLSNPIGEARALIVNNVDGAQQKKMLAVLDFFIFQSAVTKAHDTYVSKPLLQAKNIIEKYASSEETKTEMRLALDKHVYHKAEKALNDIYINNPAKHAKRIIEKYASTPERRDAMLRQLGFL